MQTIDYTTLQRLAAITCAAIHEHFGSKAMGPLLVYPVPRGGVPAAMALMGTNLTLQLVDRPDLADFVMDDLIDTGSTAERYPDKPFFALIDKRTWNHGDEWIVWPWEGDSVGGIEDNVRRLIQYAGDDATREGLLETPKRVAKAWSFWCKGYEQDPAEVLKTFEDGAEGTDEMVVVKDIPIYSKCEHHMADIFGTVTIAYLPNGKVVGLSKLSRLAEIFARRLQVQERLTCQIADALMEHLAPLGCGVVIRARHMCMESRGVCQQGHHTITSALRGVFKDDPTVRAEFLAFERG